MAGMKDSPWLRNWLHALRMKIWFLNIARGFCISMSKELGARLSEVMNDFSFLQMRLPNWRQFNGP